MLISSFFLLSLNIPRLKSCIYVNPLSPSYLIICGDNIFLSNFPSRQKKGIQCSKSLFSHSVIEFIVNSDQVEPSIFQSHAISFFSVLLDVLHIYAVLMSGEHVLDIPPFIMWGDLGSKVLLTVVSTQQSCCWLLIMMIVLCHCTHWSC